MAADFEAVWVELLRRVEDRVDGFKTVTRRPREQYGLEQYPVLELVEGNESEEQSGTNPPFYTAEAVLGIGCRVVDGSESPFSQLNGLLRSVREALERKPGDREDGPGEYGHYTNLGARIQSLSLGTVEKGWSVASNDVWAKIPITITTY